MKYEDVKILEELREKGSITEEEYQREKRRLLNDEGGVVPIIMWTTQKDQNPNVDLHGKNILNAIISYAIYAVVLTITIIGIPVAIVLGALFAVFVIIAALKANSGEYWKYPFTIQFIK